MKLEFDPHALADLKYWAKHDQKKAKKILRLIEEIRVSPFTGIGKPEPLKYMLRGCWSRRIDREHRLVYRVESHALVIYACRYHY
jgi:toxin YoeB